MKSANIRLFSLFFSLFSVSTVLLAICIALGSFAISESRAKEYVASKTDELVAMMREVLNEPVSVARLEQLAKEPRVEILVARDKERWTTWQAFPEPGLLLNSAERMGELYFAKYDSRYYVLMQQDDNWLAVTSLFANLLVYPDHWVYWPWFAAVIVLAFCYLALARLLRPVKDSIQCVKKLSRGELDYRIERHPGNELAALTLGLNQMTQTLQQLFASKDELLLAISHELRTPMARMQVSLGMLEPGQIKEQLGSDIAYMNELIEQLLEGERLQQGNKVLHLTSFFLPSLIEDVLAEQGAESRVTLTSAIPEEAIMIDLGRIRFLLRNLIANALQYSTADTLVSVAVTQTTDSFCFAISDKGPGIAEHELENIFEPFYCGGNIANRSTEGTGLGLFLCRRIAQAHKGSLTVTSRLGQGSTFYLTLPVS